MAHVLVGMRMGDTLYDQDAVLWADAQAELLRRLSRCERVNEQIDWENVIEEVQDVGLDAIRTVQSLLRRAIEHLLKIHGWPEGAVGHWTDEVGNLLADAEAAWTPSMRQRIDLGRVYERAWGLVSRSSCMAGRPLPCPSAARSRSTTLSLRTACRTLRRWSPR